MIQTVVSQRIAALQPTMLTRRISRYGSLCVSAAPCTPSAIRTLKNYGEEYHV
jgi:hypothetical protein